MFELQPMGKQRQRHGSGEAAADIMEAKLTLFEKNKKLLNDWFLLNAKRKIIDLSSIEEQGCITTIPVGKSSTLCLVTNWQMLWRCLSFTDDDVFGNSIPFFQACVYFFMNRRTMHLAWFLFVYTTLILFFSMHFLPMYAKSTFIMGVIPNVLFFAVYHWGYRMYRGEKGLQSNMVLFSRVTEAKLRLAEEEEEALLRADPEANPLHGGRGAAGGDSSRSDSTSSSGSAFHSSFVSRNSNNSPGIIAAGVKRNKFKKESSSLFTPKTRYRRTVSGVSSSGGIEMPENQHFKPEKSWMQLFKVLVRDSILNPIAMHWCGITIRGAEILSNSMKKRNEGILPKCCTFFYKKCCKCCCYICCCPCMLCCAGESEEQATAKAKQNLTAKASTAVPPMDRCESNENASKSGRRWQENDNDNNDDDDDDDDDIDEVTAVGFYELLNITAKFIAVHRGSPPVFGRTVLIIMLIFTLSALASGAYQAYERWVLIGICYWGTQPEVKQYLPKDMCTFAFYDGIFQFGYLLPVFYKPFICLMLMTILGGLAYATEMSFQLSEHWVNRYAHLRQVKVIDEEHERKQALLVQDQHLRFRAQYSKVSGSKNMQSSATSSIESELLPASESIGLVETDSGQDESNAAAEASASATAVPQDSEEYSIFKTVPIIKTDCVECYLFRQNIIQELSNHWTTLLLVYELAFLIMSAFNCYLYIAPKRDIIYPTWLFLYLLIYLGGFVVYPLLSIAHSNYGVDKILGKIFLAADSDYAAIGGRAKWVKYIASNSAYWSIFGIPITYNLLVGMASFIFASGGLAVTRIYGNSVPAIG